MNGSMDKLREALVSPEGAALLVVAIVATFIPTFIALIRRHEDLKMIAILNVVFFWTFTIWIALIVWAASGVKSARLVEVINRWRARR